MPDSTPNTEEDQLKVDELEVNNAEPKRTSKKSLIILAVVSLTMLLMGVGAAAYTAIVVNSPDRIWDQAMQNTSAQFGELSQKLQESPVNGGSVQGSFTSTAPIPVTANLNGKWFEKSAEFSGETSVAGIQVGGELRVVGSDPAQEPEIFIKIDGLDRAEPILTLLQPELTELIPAVNDVWYRIDDATRSSFASEDDSVSVVSPEELSMTSERLSSVVQDRLFSADESKAVFAVNNPVGREEFEGADTYKYDVIVQKQQFIDFTNEISAIVEGTSLQSTLNNSTGNSAGSLEQITLQLQETDFSKMRAEVWVDMDMKYFRNVRFTLPDSDSGSKGYVDFGLDYEGGDELPFNIRIVTESKTLNGDALSLLLTATLNKKTTDVKLGFTLSGSTDSQQITASGELVIIPSDEALEVEAPNDARNVSELLSLLMSGQLPGFMPEEFTGIDPDTYRLDDIEL